jgi:hypothetical protein
MTQAYHNLGIYNVPVVVTNLYVRFKPTSVDQLAILDSVMEIQNLELFDTPFDYDVTYERDYYQDPSIPAEQITWQYAVVPPTFQFPAGIQYQTLAQIHIPGDNYTAVETAAEDLAAGGGGIDVVAKGGPQPNIPLCVDGYHWDAAQNKCVANNCPDGYHWDVAQNKCVGNNCPVGYHWNGTGCVADQVTPPAPAADAAVPAGDIKVYDNNSLSAFGVRKARVVAKRWFKVERGYTDNNGHFQLSKRFKNKVRVNVKFKNDDAQVRGFRGIRLWQMFFPVKKILGIYDANKATIAYTFDITGDMSSKGNRYFAAATIHNAVQEYRTYATQEGIGQPAATLKIILSNYGNGSASTPLFAKRSDNSLVSEMVQTYLTKRGLTVVGGITAALGVLVKQVDILFSYNYGLANFKSDKLKEVTYHELTHAAHYVAAGPVWHASFVSKEISEVVANFNGANSPYGNGTSVTTAPMIALGESWAYYMGHYLADRTYGTTASCQTEQAGGTTWCKTNGTLHPHIDVVENFNPNLPSDPFKWIPKGLFQDLRDVTNEPTPILDQVSNYTNQQMFGAFLYNIYSLQDYRVKLLQMTTNSTSAFVPSLFSQYGY